jgi:hypothetical protein
MILIVILLGAGHADELPRPRHVPLLRQDFEVEYYVPLHSSRQIQSIFSNITFGAQFLKRVLVVALGFTWTGAWGDIIQDHNNTQVRLNTGVFGAGPIFLIRVEPFHVKWFSLALDLVGGIIIYTDKFPPGGDIYNFSWRMGGAFQFRLKDKLTLDLGSRWMHVSNGQGLCKCNPSYEGVAAVVGLTWRI